MKGSDFMKNYIKIDKKERKSEKIDEVAKKYKEYAYYLELVQRENVGIIFMMFLKFNFFFVGMVNELLKRNDYRYYINILCTHGFIESKQPKQKTVDFVSKHYYEHIAKQASYYFLTKKGKDFLKIDYIRKYLIKEYRDQLEEMER